MSESDRVKVWLQQILSARPELDSAIGEIEPFLSEKGFSGKDFEAMVQKQINTIENDLSASS